MADSIRTEGLRAHTCRNTDAYPGELHQRDATWPATNGAFQSAFGGDR
jgi:hypothetical protein